MMSRFELFKLVCEAVSLAGMLGIFFLHPAIRRFLGSHRRQAMPWMVVGFFCMTAVAQFTTRNQYYFPQRREPFPLTRWAMFAGGIQSVDEARLYDWLAVFADGTRAPLNPALLYVTPNATTHFTKTVALGQAIEDPGPARCQEAIEAADWYAKGLAARHEQLHPNTAVASVELWERRFRLAPAETIPEPFSDQRCRRIRAFSTASP
jgi:hypothetical protein